MFKFHLRKLTFIYSASSRTIVLINKWGTKPNNFNHFRIFFFFFEFKSHLKYETSSINNCCTFHQGKHLPRTDLDSHSSTFSKQAGAGFYPHLRDLDMSRLNCNMNSRKLWINEFHVANTERTQTMPHQFYFYFLSGMPHQFGFLIIAGKNLLQELLMVCSIVSNESDKLT